MKNKIFGSRKFFKKVILIFKMQCFSTKTLPTLPRRFRFLPLSNKRNFFLLFYNGGLTTYPFLFFSSFSFQFLKIIIKEKENEIEKRKEGRKVKLPGRVGSAVNTELSEQPDSFSLFFSLKSKKQKKNIRLETLFESL